MQIVSKDKITVAAVCLASPRLLRGAMQLLWLSAHVEGTHCHGVPLLTGLRRM